MTDRYLYGPAIDMLLANLEPDNDIFWYLTDHLGSVRDVANKTITLVDHVKYDSFGRILYESSPTNGDRFKYTAREYDSATGLYYYRARYYDPSTGRFIAQDPIGFEAGDANIYRYVQNRPTLATDPTGLDGDVPLTPDRAYTDSVLKFYSHNGQPRGPIGGGTTYREFPTPVTQAVRARPVEGKFGLSEVWGISSITGIWLLYESYPGVDKPGGFAGGGRTGPYTSRASGYLRGRFPKKLPPSMLTRLAGTAGKGAIAARFTPYAGWSLVAFDVYGLLDWMLPEETKEKMLQETDWSIPQF